MSKLELHIESRHKLGLNIKHLRKAQNLSQAQLGLMVGCDRSHISRIERGKYSTTLDTLIAIAGGLGVSPSELLTGVAEPQHDTFRTPPMNPSKPNRNR